jgi:CRISPR/Cas system-associated endoribonuclease Cas2
MNNESNNPSSNWEIPVDHTAAVPANPQRTFMGDEQPSYFFFNPKFRGSDRNIGDPSYGFLWQWVLDDIALMGQRIAQLTQVMQITKGLKPDFAVDFLKDSRTRLKAHKNMLNTFFQRRQDGTGDCDILTEMLERNLKITDLIKRAIDEDCDFGEINYQLSKLNDLVEQKQEAIVPEGDPNRGRI